MRLNGLSTLVPALQAVFRNGLQGASAGRPCRLTPHRPPAPGAAVPIPAGLKPRRQVLAGINLTGFKKTRKNLAFRFEIRRVLILAKAERIFHD